jgi:hypothetical protein
MWLYCKILNWEIRRREILKMSSKSPTNMDLKQSSDAEMTFSRGDIHWKQVDGHGGILGCDTGTCLCSISPKISGCPHSTRCLLAATTRDWLVLQAGDKSILHLMRWKLRVAVWFNFGMTVEMVDYHLVAVEHCLYVSVLECDHD